MSICVAIATTTQQKNLSFICANLHERVGLFWRPRIPLPPLVVGVPFIERPKKQVRFGSIPKSALLKSRRPYWGSKKFFTPETSDGPASRVRAWAGKSFLGRLLGKKNKRSGLEIGTKMVHIGGGIILGGRPGSSQVHLRARVSDARSTRYFRVPTSAIYYYRPTENVYFRARQRHLRWA